MGSKEVAMAMQRAEQVFRRKPAMGLHDDAPVTVRWERGTRMVASHASGAQMQTDMPVELGGTGDQITPGWLFRAGVASCAATTIAMHAAASGIELAHLEVRITSRSDTRGLLGLEGDDGQVVYPGPHDLRMHVRIAAHGVAPEALRALVERSRGCAPMGAAVENAVPMALDIDVGDA
jgi:uncharacterized OsmC-like protein